MTYTQPPQARPQRAIIYLAATAVFASLASLTWLFPWKATPADIADGSLLAQAWKLSAWAMGLIVALCVASITLYRLHHSRIAAHLASSIPIICALSIMLLIVSTAKGDQRIQEVHAVVLLLFTVMVFGVAAARRMRNAMQAEEFAVEALKD